MRHFLASALAVCGLLLSSTNLVFASVQSGAVSTDRFGFTGTVYKYDTLADAQAGNTSLATETINVGNRDLSLYIVNDYSSLDQNANIITSPWNYSTNPNGAGWGNTRGNTGLGFIQLYEYPSNSRQSISMEFGNFDGTYYTDYTLTLSGQNGSDYARFTLTNNNVNDGGVYLDYTLSLTATGLQGSETSPGVIESTNHPTGVTGSYKGIFQNTTATANAGYYAFDLTLDMDSWAYSQRDNLLFPLEGFADSYFATVGQSVVPEPTTILVWSGIAACAGLAYLRKKQSA